MAQNKIEAPKNTQPDILSFLNTAEYVCDALELLETHNSVIHRDSHKRRGGEMPAQVEVAYRRQREIVDAFLEVYQTPKTINTPAKIMITDIINAGGIDQQIGQIDFIRRMRHDLVVEVRGTYSNIYPEVNTLPDENVISNISAALPGSYIDSKELGYYQSLKHENAVKDKIAGHILEVVAYRQTFSGASK